jgi:predicted phosphodiesterase
MKDNTVRIGVLSDTHVYGFNRDLKHIIDEHFSDVDLILHAGDLVDLSVLELCGEMDV